MRVRGVLTPALEREAARMRALRARSMRGCKCGMGALPTSPELPILTVDQIKASLPAGSQASFQAYVSGYSAPEAEQVGGAALSALANGSISSADIVHAYAGAVATVPVVGWIMAGLAEFVYANGKQISDAIEKFSESIGISGCHADVKSLPEWQSLAGIPKPTPGSFASVVLPVLLQGWADWAACSPMAHGIDFMAWKTQLVPAIASLWNKNAPGPAVDYFVPRMYDGNFMCPNQGNMLCDPGGQGRYAFQPLSQVPASARSGGENVFWYRITANAGPLRPPPKVIAFSTAHLTAPAKPKVIAFSTAHLTPAVSAKAPAPAGMSTGGKVAAAAGAAGAGVLLWWLGTHRWRWVTPRFARRLVR